MVRESTVRALEEGVGELLEVHGDRDASDFERYGDDPVGFIREVLGDDPWSRQREIAEAVRDEALVSVASANGTGKDWLAARLALWWVYARRGLAVVTGPTEAQVLEIVMRKELRQAFVPELPGKLGVRALRPRGDGRAGILAKTASQVSALTGLHEARVLFLITEAQHEELALAFDAAFANAVGEEDRILAYGNPTNPVGPFYDAHQPGSGWRAIRISAADVPNVREGEVVVPGLITRQGIERIRKRYGEESGFFKARVMGEFPQEAEEGLFRRPWLQEAADRHEERLRAAAGNGRSRILAVDVARHGADKTVVAVRRGDVIEKFESWGGADTEETADRVQEMAWKMSANPGRSTVSDIVVDAVGIGAGVYDRLANADVPWKVHEYKGSRAAFDDDRYRNVRAESFWTLRERCRSGAIALPEDDDLVQELMALRWRPDPQERVQLEAKEDLRDRLGRSPDKADAVGMAFYVTLLSEKRKATMQRFPV